MECHGVGKSETIRKYWMKHRDSYSDQIFWINSESEASIEQSFLDVATLAGLSINNENR